jgi:hypothetical protein
VPAAAPAGVAFIGGECRRRLFGERRPDDEARSRGQQTASNENHGRFLRICRRNLKGEVGGRMAAGRIDESERDFLRHADPGFRCARPIQRTAKRGLRRLARKRNLANEVRQSNPTGNHFRFTEMMSSPKIKNISLFQKGNRWHDSAVSPDKRGARDRLERAVGCGGRKSCDGRAWLVRTAKTCGPDAAALASSSEEANASEGRRWQKSRSPGRARYKP